MNPRCLVTLGLLAWLVVGAAAAAPLELAANDTVQSVLSAHQGKRVTLVLGSGTELTGTVALINGDIVQLRELSGKEYFDAVVALPGVTAVVIRTHP